jgi:hypothetical protein
MDIPEKLATLGTQDEDKHNKNTAQKDKRMGNTDTTKKLEMNIGALEG